MSRDAALARDRRIGAWSIMRNLRASLDESCMVAVDVTVRSDDRPRDGIGWLVNTTSTCRHRSPAVPYVCEHVRGLGGKGQWVRSECQTGLGMPAKKSNLHITNIGSHPKVPRYEKRSVVLHNVCTAKSIYLPPASVGCASKPFRPDLTLDHGGWVF